MLSFYIVDLVFDKKKGIPKWAILLKLIINAA